MREDNGGAVGAKGQEWYKQVQEADGQLLGQDSLRLLEQEDQQVEPPQHDRRQGSQVSQGTVEGRG